jgi:hypothetical protein
MLLVVLRQPLTHLSNRASHHVIGGVIVRRAVKNLYADGSLLKLGANPIQGLLDNEFQNCGITFAVMKHRTGKDQIKLIPHHFAFRVRGGLKGCA